MKKILSILLLSTVIFACNQPTEWSEEQKIEFKDHLRRIENLLYLNSLRQEQFDILAEDVSNSIELYNPNYIVFMQLPNSEDTIKTYVITRMSHHLSADARNLRDLYPYHLLVADSILSKDLSHAQIDAFYNCLASKLLDEYVSMEFFMGALSYGNKAQHQAEIFQIQCAKELGDSVQVNH